MNINQVRYFLSIVQCGSFFEAAMREYISQSSLSKQIKALEIELDVELFKREKNRIFLTEAGKCFLGYAEKIVRFEDSMNSDLDKFRQQRSDEVHFATIPILKSYGVSEILSDFQHSLKTDNMLVHYDIMEMEQKEILPLLRMGTIDFAIMRKSSFDDFSKYEKRLFFTDELGLICGKEHELSNDAGIRLEQLKKDNIVLISPKSEIYNVCMERLKEVGLERNVIATATRHRNLLSMVQNKVGVTIFARRMLDEFDELKFVPLSKPIYNNIYIVKSKEKHLTGTAARLWKFLCNRFPEYVESE